MLPVTTALSGSNPISASAVTDLPQPDSPTSPSVSPRLSAKLTPRTADAGPRLVLSRTPRPSTSIRGALTGPLISPLPRQSGIEQVAQSVTEKIEAEHGNGDSSTGIDREHRRLEQQRLCIVQHAAPGRLRRLGTEPE